VKKHKKSLIFLIKFFVTYFILVAIYDYYLTGSQQKSPFFKTSSITTLVANQSKDVLTFFGYHVQAIQHEQEMSVKILFEERYVAKIVEGCNSLSLIILFISFIVAFKGPVKATVLFGFLGGAFVYFINVLRIALLVVLIDTYPSQIQFLHNVVFPGIIYGTILILWIIWTANYSTYRK
jgi:exosortase family protein XrtF